MRESGASSFLSNMKFFYCNQSIAVEQGKYLDFLQKKNDRKNRAWQKDRRFQAHIVIP